MSEQTKAIARANLHLRAFVVNGELPHWQEWAAQSGDSALVDAVATLNAALEHITVATQPAVAPEDAGDPPSNWRALLTRASSSKRGRWRNQLRDAT